MAGLRLIGPSDNGGVFTTHTVRDRLKRVGAKTLYITSVSPCENGYIASFNEKLTNESLEYEVFETLHQAYVKLIEHWAGATPDIAPARSLEMFLRHLQVVLTGNRDAFDYLGHHLTLQKLLNDFYLTHFSKTQETFLAGAPTYQRR